MTRLELTVRNMVLAACEPVKSSADDVAPDLEQSSIWAAPVVDELNTELQPVPEQDRSYVPCMVSAGRRRA